MLSFAFRAEDKYTHSNSFLCQDYEFQIYPENRLTLMGTITYELGHEEAGFGLRNL